MSLAVFEETEKDIEQAYEQKSKTKIEKETSYVLSQIVVILMSAFKDRLKRITFDSRDIHFDEKFLFSDKNRLALLKWLRRLMTLEIPATDAEFGKLKLDLEQWYYQIGGKDITFDYVESYLLTTSETAELLGVSTVTVNKYMKRGLEQVNTNSHNKIPKHVVPLWKDPVYSIKMQMLYQEKKIRNQSPEERLKEVISELLDFQIKYEADTLEEAFPIVNGDDIDGLPDYYEWEALEEEYQQLKKELYRKRKSE
ncbi:DNA-binding protein [Evansella sp. AB-rgal1]|uniref:DNA-binding protein n=1 Tax=Evansella sp. AB-rgal1 TaxID=3242696 RepID=UPI00359E1987